MASIFGNRFASGKPKEETEAPPTPPKTPIQAPPRPTPVASQPLGFETVLGATSILDGNLKSSGNIRLDGTFKGTLEITGNVLVGETAVIDADIDAKNISIAGTVRGNVSGNKVQLLRTGRVWGDISASALTTEEGAFIDGKISMKAAATPPTFAPIPVDEAMIAPETQVPSGQDVAEDLPPITLEGEDRPDVTPDETTAHD